MVPTLEEVLLTTGMVMFRKFVKGGKNLDKLENLVRCTNTFLFLNLSSTGFHNQVLFCLFI